MTLIEPQPEDLRIVFIEIDLVFGLVPLPEVGAFDGGTGSANGGSEAIGVGLGIRVDVGLKSVEEEDWEFEEGECESEDEGK